MDHKKNDMKKNKTDMQTNQEQGFHGNQYVDSQGHPRNSSQNSGGSQKTGGQKSGGSKSGK